jgi:hypothetical protein
MRIAPLLLLLALASCKLPTPDGGAGQQHSATGLPVIQFGSSSDIDEGARRYYSVIDPQTGCEYLLSPGGHSDSVLSIRFDGNGKPMCPGTPRSDPDFKIDRTKGNA